METPRALIGLAAAGITVLSTLSLAAPAAQASVGVTTSPVRIVVDAQSETFTVPVSTTGVAQGTHGASLWVTYPGDLVPELVGSGTGTGPQVAVTATVDTTRLLTWGPMQATVMDDADGSATPVTLDVRRRTDAVLNQIELRSGHRVALGARVTHYSPAVNGYVSSNLSPVVFQEYVEGGWVSRATSFSTADGLAGVILRATPGTHYYRAVRTTGVTVWPDVSSTRKIVVPS